MHELQTHKNYLESKYKELDQQIGIYNKVLEEMKEDRVRLEKLIKKLDIIMGNTKE